MTRGDVCKAFRSDINGLRALAVASVVAFHFKLGPLRAGGFAGVDVFFAVSGFLMTQIIVAKLDRSAFSLLDFFRARSRRIVPAFTIMVVGVLIGGFVLLNPLQYEVLAERAVWALPFVSNVLFARQGAYFVSPDQNWLLHTWSLAVEAQFYLVYPMVLILGRRWGLWPIVLLAMASFLVMALSLYTGGDSRTWSFYMLWSRAWEFLFGGLAAYAFAWCELGPKLRFGLHYLGVAAIILTMLVFHNTTSWPSPATLLPVVGTAAVLLAGHTNPCWANIVPVRYLGVWSYSVYLWHWPVAAAFSFFDHWSLTWRLAGVALSVLLGIASYEFVEHRITIFVCFRHRLVHIALPLSVAAVAFATISAANGLDAVRYGFDQATLARLQNYRSAKNDWLKGLSDCDKRQRLSRYLEACKLGNINSDDVVVVGDSFAAQLSARYKNNPLLGHLGVSFVTRRGCAPISNTEEFVYGSDCEAWTSELYPYLLSSHARRVVFTAHWQEYQQHLLCLRSEPNCGDDLTPAAYAVALTEGYSRMSDLWRRLAHQGKEVVVIGLLPTPGPEGDPMLSYDSAVDGRDIFVSYDDLMTTEAATNERLSKAVRSAGATLIDAAAALCPHNECPIVRKGIPLYVDSSHLRRSMMNDPRFAIFDRAIILSLERPLVQNAPADRPAKLP